MKKDIAAERDALCSQEDRTWAGAVKCVATLDALRARARGSQMADGTMCRPSFVETPEEGSQMLKVTAGRKKGE